MSKDIKFEPCKIVHLHEKIRFHPKLNPSQKLFYAELESVEKQFLERKCPYTNTEWAKIFKVSSQTVFNWIRGLANEKLIEFIGDFDKNNPKIFIRTTTIE